MIISPGESLTVDLLGHRACIFFKLLIEISKVPSKKVGSLDMLLRKVQFMSASPPTLGGISLNLYLLDRPKILHLVVFNSSIARKL